MNENVALRSCISKDFDVPDVHISQTVLNWNDCTTTLVVERKVNSMMNFDPGMVNQMLNMIPYPVGKSQLLQMAKQFGANEQITGLIDRLPDKTYNSAQELQEAIGGLGNLGDLGNMGGFKL